MSITHVWSSRYPSLYLSFYKIDDIERLIHELSNAGFVSLCSENRTEYVVDREMFLPHEISNHTIISFYDQKSKESVVSIGSVSDSPSLTAINLADPRASNEVINTNTISTYVVPQQVQVQKQVPILDFSPGISYGLSGTIKIIDSSSCKLIGTDTQKLVTHSKFEWKPNNTDRIAYIKVFKEYVRTRKEDIQYLIKLLEGAGLLRCYKLATSEGFRFITI